MPLKVFIEYKLIKEKRGSFMSMLPELKSKSEAQNVRNYEIYEGTDQPDLIVEDFLVDNFDHYLEIKNERLSPSHPFWNRHHNHIVGGINKVHIWAFQSLS